MQKYKDLDPNIFYKLNCKIILINISLTLFLYQILITTILYSMIIQIQIISIIINQLIFLFLYLNSLSLFKSLYNLQSKIFKKILLFFFAKKTTLKFYFPVLFKCQFLFQMKLFEILSNSILYINIYFNQYYIFNYLI